MKEKKRIFDLFHHLCVLFIVVLGCLVIAACGGDSGGGDDDDDSGDTQAPSVPLNLSVTASSSSRINLTWSASTDDVGVAAYNIYRDGDFLKSVPSTTSSDTGLTASTNYCYRVSAVDAASNESAQATQSCATTNAPVLCASLDVTDSQPTGTIEDLRPVISATFTSPCGDGIDLSSIEMLLDGNAVTPTITGSGSVVTLTYTPADDLANEVDFEVTVRADDSNGVSGEKIWEFTTGFFY